MEKPPVLGVPQLSNEMQLSILNKVKSGELSIDAAINQARKDNLELFHQEEKQATQYNFSVHKFNRYRWQKRVLQVDFNTKMVCSIEKGIIKRQLPFASVKNCHYGTGTKFSISFKGRHDYELEATSVQEKQKILQLVSQIIHSNIYSQPAEPVEEVYQVPSVPKILRQGQLLLQKGGMASFKWKRYEAHLHAGQLTLLPWGCQSTDDSDTVSNSALPIIIHFSDGKARVETSQATDTFTLLTHCSEYQFKVPVTDVLHTADNVQGERDSWVQAIDSLCMKWKRCSQSEPMYEELKGLRTSEDGTVSDTLPLSEEALSEEEEPTAPTDACAPVLPSTPSVPKPRSPVLLPTTPPPSSSPQTGLQPRSLVPLPTTPLPSSSPQTGPQPRSLVPLPATPPSSSSSQTGLHPVVPPPPPVAPPLLRKLKLIKERTKAFHWDLVPKDKIDKSFWTHGASGKAKIDASRLFEQFKVKVSENIVDSVDTNNHVEIMLNQKIAHNFNIFLKSFPVQPGELREKLFIINEEDGGLSDEQIASLRRYVPTIDDVEKYKSYSGPPSDLHIVDQYMLAMCDIPYLSPRLDLLLTLRELPITMEDLEPLIDQKIRMCQQLIGSQKFVCVLEYLLAVGNYLNEHAGKDKAKGFRLSSLTKLCQLRGGDRRVTLLHALVEQIVLHEPGLATFPSELAEFDTVPGASIKGLTAEIDVVKNELQKVLQYRKTNIKRKSAVPQHPKFSKDLKAAIEKYNMYLQQLTKKSEEMRKIYSDILVKFGEAADQDSQELFGWVRQFTAEFKKAHAELLK